MEESKDSRPDESQEPSGPPEAEMTGADAAQEQPATSELPAAEEPTTGNPSEPSAEPVESSAEANPLAAGAPARGGSRNLLVTAAAVAVVAFAAVAIFVLGMFTHAMVESDDNGGGAQAQAAAPVQPTAEPQPTVEPTVDDDPALGPEDAPVTIIEFSDFQCPYCARFQSETLPQILQNYGDRVRFVYRDFPLTGLHANALKAAEASECAHDQGKYWEYHDLLFQNQSALDVDSLKGYAASLGLDTTTFNSCLDSDQKMDEVRKDEQDGLAAGVQGTPAFFINGQAISGAQPYAVFQAAIEAALKEAGG